MIWSQKTFCWNHQTKAASRLLTLVPPASPTRLFTPTSRVDSTEPLRSFSVFPTPQLSTCGVWVASWPSFTLECLSSQVSPSKNNWVLLWKYVACLQTTFLRWVSVSKYSLTQKLICPSWSNLQMDRLEFPAPSPFTWLCSANPIASSTSFKSVSSGTLKSVLLPLTLWCTSGSLRVYLLKSWYTTSRC